MHNLNYALNTTTQAGCLLTLGKLYYYSSKPGGVLLDQQHNDSPSQQQKQIGVRRMLKDASSCIMAFVNENGDSAHKLAITICRCLYYQRIICPTSLCDTFEVCL